MSGPLADANTYRFSSKEWHANAGLYYYGLRYYEPNLQRWLNRDPIEEIGDLNLFRLVLNNPICWNDPLGLTSIYFNDLLDPERGSDHPLQDFASACKKQFGPIIKEYTLNDLFQGKIGNFLDDLDTWGQNLKHSMFGWPNSSDRGESLGKSGGFGDPTKFRLDPRINSIKNAGLNLKYGNSKFDLSLGTRLQFDKMDHPGRGGVQCNLSVNVRF